MLRLLTALITTLVLLSACGTSATEIPTPDSAQPAGQQADSDTAPPPEDKDAVCDAIDEAIIERWLGAVEGSSRASDGVGSVGCEWYGDAWHNESSPVFKITMIQSTTDNHWQAVTAEAESFPEVGPNAQRNNVFTFVEQDGVRFKFWIVPTGEAPDPARGWSPIESPELQGDVATDLLAAFQGS